MSEGHIYIYGEIISDDDKKDNPNGVSLSDVVSQMNANSDATELNVHIHSVGGDVDTGFAMYDVLRSSGKKIITTIEGLCASIATVPALAADPEDRHATPNSKGFIHNPWGQPKGDADTVSTYAELLKKEELRLANFYAAKTGLNVEDVQSMMKSETSMNAEEYKEKGFISVITNELKAVAKFNINKMDSKEFETKTNVFMDKLEKFMNRFSPKVKALIVTMGGGEMVDFGEEVKEVADIVVGTPVSAADENPLKDEYVMEDGTTLKVEGGKVSEMIPKAEEEPEGGEDVEALKAEIESLKAEKADLEASKAEADETIKASAKKIEDYESEIKGFQALATDMKDFMKGVKTDNKQVEGAKKVNRDILNKK